MKYILGLILFSVSYTLFAQSVLDASIVRLFLNDQHYVQVNTYFLGAELPHKKLTDSTIQSEVNLTLIFSKGDQIVKAEKYAVHGPESPQKVDFVFNERVALDTGEYQLELIGQNPIDDSEIYSGSTSFVIEQIDDFKVSDILPIASISKSAGDKDKLQIQGYQVEYLPFNFVPRNMNELKYYYEFNIPDGITEIVLRAETLYALNGNNKYDLGTKYKKISLVEGQNIYPIFSHWDLTDVASGDYYIEAKIIDKEKRELARSYYPFTQSNPAADASKLKSNLAYDYLDTLDAERLEYLGRATLIKSPPQDVPMIDLFLKNKNFKSLKTYLYNFWAGENPADPHGEMSTYMKLAQLIDDRYDSGFRYGFETDRGRVRLRYGQPNDMIEREQDMASVPYEIWTYNHVPATGQTNVKFVFYNPSLVTNDMELIHSTAIGEVKNYQWERLIYSDVKNEYDGPNHFDANQMQDNINRNARRTYEDN